MLKLPLEKVLKVTSTYLKAGQNFGTVQVTGKDQCPRFLAAGVYRIDRAFDLCAVNQTR